MKKLLLYVLAVMAFAACTNDAVKEQSSLQVDAPETITVGFEGDDETRIQLNEAQKTVWTEGDLVSVFYFSDANQKWQFQGETGDRIGNLKRVNAGVPTTQTIFNVVAYPYNNDYFLNTRTGALHATLPATQHYLKDSYGVGDNLMVAQSEFTQFSLKSVCGWLKLQFTGDGEVVKSITFKGNNGEQVAGLVYVDTATAETTLASEMGSADDNNAGGNLVFDDTIFAEVTLDCGEGVTLGDEATAFYIALPPQTFENGFTVDIECDGYKPMTLSTTNTLNIERNHIQPMAEIGFASEKVEYGFEFENISLEGTDLTVDIIPSDKTLPYIVMSVKKAYIENFGLESDEALFADDYSYFEWLSGFYGQSVLEIMNSRSKVDRYTMTVSECTETIVIYAYYFDSQTGELLGDIARCEYVIENNESNNEVLSITIEDIDGVPHYVVTPADDSVYWYITGLSKSGYDTLISTYGGEEAIVNAYFSMFADIYSVLHQGSMTIPIDIKDGVTEYVYIACIINITDDGYAISNVVSEEYSYSNTDKDIDIFKGDMPNNEIWYVTADNTPVELSSADYFGVEFISNTYEDFGVIKFNGDITQIAPYAFYNSNITQVRLPESLIIIEYNAFDICSNLTAVTIPNSVTSIEELAFASCTSLQEVHIPENVSYLGDGAFVRCNSLVRFTGKYSTEDGRCLIYNNTLISFAPKGIVSYDIPESITQIGSEVFNRFEEIEEVVIPAGVTSIGSFVFAECPNLRSLYCKAVVPPTLSDNCFGFEFDLGIGITKNFKIYVPVESLDAYLNADGWRDYADSIVGYDFYSGEVVLPDTEGNNIIRYTAYNKVFPNHDTALGNVTVLTNEYDPETGEGIMTCSGTIEMLDSWAFSDNHDLITITLPNSVKTFGLWTFCNCSNLVEFVTPDSVTELGAYTFDGCSKLRKFTFPTNQPSRGFGVFDNCISLEELRGGGVTADGRCYAPNNCIEIFAPVGLTEYTIPDEITGIGQGAFDISSNLESITFNDNFEWNNARFINHPHLREFKGKNVSADGRCLIINGSLEAFVGNGIEEYVVPNNVTSLGGWSFSIWRNLKRVTLPEGLKEIDGAFYWCSGLEEVNIPSTVTRIGSQSFEGCENLTSIILPEGLKTIEHGTFGGCINLRNITLPNSLRAIDANALAGCKSLTSVTFGVNIERVDGNVFGDCNNLSAAYFTGATPPAIYQDTFKNCATNFAIYVPKNVVAEYRSSFENLPYNIYAYDFEKGEVVE